MYDESRETSLMSVKNAYLEGMEQVTQAGVSPSIAKALLQLNPALREQGFTTTSLVAGSQQASAAKNAPPTEKGKSAAAPTAAPSPGSAHSPTADTFALFEGFSGQIATIEEEAKRQRAAIEANRQRALLTIREHLEKWLLENDPDLRSPVTQEALQRHKSELSELGFSVRDYVTKHRANKNIK